ETAFINRIVWGGQAFEHEPAGRHRNSVATVERSFDLRFAVTEIDMKIAAFDTNGDGHMQRLLEVDAVIIQLTFGPVGPVGNSGDSFTSTTLRLLHHDAPALPQGVSAVAAHHFLEAVQADVGRGNHGLDVFQHA